VVFIVAAHIPIAGMSLIPVMMGWPLLLLPIHIVFFELMVDPTCTIVFESEPEDKDVMSRPPRPTDAKIFDIGILSLALRQGLALLAIMVVIYVSAQYAGLASEQARALTFTAMIIGDIWLIFVNRSWALPLWQSVRQHNASLWWVIAATLMTLGIGLFVPPVSALFHFGAVNGQLLGACALAVTVALALLSGLRIFRRPS
jgi:Ca2+-transporting ATPase